MSVLMTIIQILHWLVCVFLIVIVLLQVDKSEGLSGAFGGGGAGAFFGERGGDEAITKITTISAILFMFTSITLAWNGDKLAKKTPELPTYQQTMPMSAPMIPSNMQIQVTPTTPAASEAPVAQPVQTAPTAP
ncbi:MAG: preprotein translocase subunit SecG [Candidatus Riflebacteria bacterium]|nr:preprotein translocase subunit SecG [Candidatus Riflebacteria bacterium]